jgi:Ni,Fe-hydrogenase III large subunit/Ni,Fe-hydrogenase III component G
MSGKAQLAKLREAFGRDIRAVQERIPGKVYFDVSPNALPRMCKYLYRELGARFLITAGLDAREEKGCFEVAHIFSLDKDKLFVVVTSSTTVGWPVVEAITPEVPAAAWAERELYDMFGVKAEGHPDPRRLVLSDDWPQNLFPLRRDVKYGDWPPRRDDAEGEYPFKSPPEGTSTVVIGPFYPVLEEPAQLRLFVDGERVVDCDYRGFYSHRGVEKLADSMLTYNEIPFMAERICGICGFIHSTCYCEAAEEAIGVTVPDRARYIRSIMLEIERIHSHPLWLGIAGHILGFDTVLMQAWRIREPLMWLCEKITGNRKTYGMNLIGGMRRDLPKELHPEILGVLKKIEEEWIAVINAVAGDSTLKARLSGVGLLPAEAAKEFAVVGPTARGSNVAIDARADHPYAAYAELAPKVITHPDCDNWARVIVRLEETVESIRLVRKGLAELPDGPIMAEVDPNIPPGQWGLCVVEAPRGEAIHAVLTGGDNRPSRWRVRAPTYQNLQALPYMIKDETIADVPIILGSMDPCFSCTERVEVINARSGESNLLTQQDLLARSREATERLRGR